ncbi:MAG: ATP-binding cassette domain-containing protein [Acidimicrobiales bacterium]
MAGTRPSGFATKKIEESLNSPGALGARDGSASRAPVFEVRNITKRFGGVRALTGASLSIHSGEVVAVVGDNGAGKSTLMKIIGGVIRPNDGELFVDGEQAHFKEPTDARAAGIEVVYQELALADDLDVAANLFLGRELVRRWGPFRVVDKRAMQSQAKEIIAGFGVNIPTVRAHVRALSGGQRQAVAIGRAVGWGHRLIVMDEPTAALGVSETARIEGVIKSLRDRGLAVLLVSHSLDQVLRVSDRIVVLRRGEEFGTRSTVSTDSDEIVSLITGSRQDSPETGPRERTGHRHRIQVGDRRGFLSPGM